MIKDFAKKSAPKKNTTYRKKFSLLIISLAMLVPLGMFYVKYHKTINRGGLKSTIITQAQKQKTENDLTQFDFYTLLPKMQVPVSAATQQATPIQMKMSTTKPTYVLQVGSVRNIEVAKRMQKQLVALGFHTFIQNYQPDTTHWFRIMVGPYLSLENAERNQQRLRKDNLASILLRLKAS